jgi:hypothetical protein
MQTGKEIEKQQKIERKVVNHAALQMTPVKKQVRDQAWNLAWDLAIQFGQVLDEIWDQVGIPTWDQMRDRLNDPR